MHKARRKEEIQNAFLITPPPTHTHTHTYPNTHTHTKGHISQQRCACWEKATRKQQDKKNSAASETSSSEVHGMSQMQGLSSFHRSSPSWSTPTRPAWLHRRCLRASTGPTRCSSQSRFHPEATASRSFAFWSAWWSCIFSCPLRDSSIFTMKKW